METSVDMFNRELLTTDSGDWGENWRDNVECSLRDSAEENLGTRSYGWWAEKTPESHQSFKDEGREAGRWIGWEGTCLVRVRTRVWMNNSHAKTHGMMHCSLASANTDRRIPTFTGPPCYLNWQALGSIRDPVSIEEWQRKTPALTLSLQTQALTHAHN